GPAGWLPKISCAADICGQLHVNGSIVNWDFAVSAPSLRFHDGQCENVSAAIKLSKKMPPADSDKPWFSDLTSQTTIAVSNIRFRDYVADSLEGSLHAKNDVVTFDRLIVKRKENEFAVSGDYRLPKELSNA